MQPTTNTTETVHDHHGDPIGSLSREMADRFIQLRMVELDSDGRLRLVDHAEVRELVEEYLEPVSVPAVASGGAELTTADLEISRFSSFDSDLGVAEFVVRVEGIDTDRYLELFESFFSPSMNRASSAGAFEAPGRDETQLRGARAVGHRPAVGSGE